MGRKKENKNQENQKSDKSKKGGIGRVISSLILVIALAVICYSGYQLYRIFKGYHDGRSEYEKIREIATEDDDTSEDTDNADATNGEKTDSEDGFSVDFDALKAINSDVIGWIRFTPQPETINYPIVKGTDNSEYLHRTFSANENTLGAIFLNYENASDFSDRNSIIYGHRMNDGSMFAHLQDYDTKSFWESNPYFYIYTVDGRKLTYHVVMAGEVSDESSMYQFQFPDDAAYLNFLNAAKSMAFYDTGIQLSTQQKVVTLSTCTRAGDSNRIVVMGALEKEEKKVKIKKHRRLWRENMIKKDYIYEVGDIVTMKKPHPCGSKEWEILRVGADFRLKCTGCSHQIMIARKLVEKNTRDLKKKA